LLAAVAIWAIPGWWYARNVMFTGTLSGSKDAAALVGKYSFTGMLLRAVKVNWFIATDSILSTHLWYGGWSSLTVSHGIYFFFYAWIALAIVGLFRTERSPAILTLQAWYGFFWLGLTFGMYVLGLGLGWYYSSNSYLGGSN